MQPGSDHTIPLALMALFVFHSPFSRWWADLGLPWYTIFAVWGLVIVLVAVNQLRGGKPDGS